MKLQRSFRLRGTVAVFTGTLNVILLLLFYVALSTSFLMRPGIAVELPASNSLLPAMPDPVVLAITAAPVPAVYFEDQVIALDQLGSRLDAHRGSSRQLVIKADREAPLALVSQVTEMALARGYSVALATAPVHKP